MSIVGGKWGKRKWISKSHVLNGSPGDNQGGEKKALRGIGFDKKGHGPRRLIKTIPDKERGGSIHAAPGQLTCAQGGKKGAEKKSDLQRRVLEVQN